MQPEIAPGSYQHDEQPAVLSSLSVLPSAAPLLDGWYGAVRVCLIPLANMNFLNSSEENWGPLSETTFRGNPYRANTSRRATMVLDEVVLLITHTSIHFVCASAMMRSIFPKIGPA